MICPKCGFETGKESCPSCGVIFAKIRLQEGRTPTVTQPTHNTKPFAFDILATKILWVANLLYFGARGIGVSGEGVLFYAIFYGAMAFPSSLLAFMVSPFVTGLIQFVVHLVPGGSLPAATDDTVLLILVLLIGYFQWFFLVPRCAVAAWCYIDEISEKSPSKGRLLVTGVNWARIILRWVGCGYFVVLALEYSQAIQLISLFLSGAIVSVLVFRPRKRLMT